MNYLEINRLLIDDIDAKMLELFEKRLEVALQIAKYKKENNLPVLDSNREKEVITKNVKKLSNKKYQEYYEMFLKEIMNISKMYQEKIMKEEK